MKIGVAVLLTALLTGATDEATLRPRIARAEPEWEVRPRIVEQRIPVGERLNPMAFRAGGGIVALLRHPPLTSWQFIVLKPANPAGGPIQPGMGGNPDLGHPSDIVGVSEKGRAMYLDPTTSRVTGQDVGGMRYVVGYLGAPGRVRTGCALGERAIAFLDDTQPGKVFVRSVSGAAPTYSMPFPSGLIDGRDVRWTDLRFGGSQHGACVVWAPLMSTIVRVTDSTAKAMGPFVEPVPPNGAGSRVARWVRRAARPPGALDATSFPGGVAVLYYGNTDHAGRLIDLYTDAGKYVETMQLPRSADRIAGTRDRIYVLTERRDTVLFASYVLPASVRTGAVAPEPDAMVPARPSPLSRPEPD